MTLVETEYFVQGSRWPIWLIRVGSGPNDLWVIRISHQKNWFYDAKKKVWLSHDDPGFSLDELEMTLSEAKDCLQEADDLYD